MSNRYKLLAQIPNSIFEQLFSNGVHTHHWGAFLSISAWINTNGLGHIDSVVSTSPVPHICYATTDAYIGNNALEVSNAYNYDASQPIPGCGSVAVDSDFRFNIYIPISFKPTTFNFYYKFNSVSNDTASALLVL